MVKVTVLCAFLTFVFPLSGCFSAHLSTVVGPKGDCRREIEISVSKGESSPLRGMTLRSGTSLEERFVISDEELWEESEEARGGTYTKGFRKEFPEPRGIPDRIIERLFGRFVEIARPESGEIKEGDEVQFVMDKGFLKVDYTYRETIRTVPRGSGIPEGADVEISVVMPGRLTSSNADTVRGKRAVWRVNGSGFPITVEARSERSNLVKVFLLGALGIAFIVSFPFQFMRG